MVLDTVIQNVTEDYLSCVPMKKMEARLSSLQILRSIRCKECIPKRTVQVTWSSQKPNRHVKDGPMVLEMSCSGLHFQEMKTHRSIFYADFVDISECKREAHCVSLEINTEVVTINMKQTAEREANIEDGAKIAEEFVNAIDEHQKRVNDKTKSSLNDGSCDSVDRNCFTDVSSVQKGEH